MVNTISTGIALLCIIIAAISLIMGLGIEKNVLIGVGIAWMGLSIGFLIFNGK